MINILAYLREAKFSDINASQYYRTYLSMREIGRQAEDINVTMVCLAEAAAHKNDEDPFWHGHDVFYMSRIYSEWGAREYLHRIHSLGGVLILDSDDDLTETHKLVSGRGQNFQEMLRSVDRVTASTQPLADLFSQYTETATVLKNYVDVAWFQKVAASAQPIEFKKVIGFSGSPTHWGDWRLASIPFQSILQTFKNEARGMVAGVEPGCGITPRYLKYAAPDLIAVERVPFVVYPIVLSQFNIMLCAVDLNDKFNAGKSDIKALECMALGVVPICSRFGPYLALKEADAPVVIVEEETEQGWWQAMHDTLALPLGDFVELGNAGKTWVAKHRDMLKTGWREWAAFFRGV